MALMDCLTWKIAILTLFVGLMAAPESIAQVAVDDPPADAPMAPTDERLLNLDIQVEILQQRQTADRKRIEELESELVKKNSKAGGKKASILGFYSASLTSSFSEKAPLDFSLNEMEVNVGANATDSMEFRADLQVRAEAADPEENRHSETSSSGDPVDHLSGRRLLDNIAEQGYLALTLYKPLGLKIQVGKFNSEFSMDPFDQVDGNLISHTLANLHGIVRSSTGGKLGVNLIPELRVEFVVAEGWNLNLDNNSVPSFGGQVRLKVPGTIEAGLSGYYGKDNVGASLNMSNFSIDNEAPRAAITGLCADNRLPWMEDLCRRLLGDSGGAME